ncbi:hypothetical protein [Geosporobacter ferrireducens]|uniref:Uncharacterized protein n=1 Tax=Geosporobacter ferrireducens TaxID=1424294 RepID=A0A1D8GJQ2_9FIRM|nr:hypothetical protein [Geosporobacter ferrireducens]AOT71146.1 hypothetical protein Gferi_17270 [Geosporobacter ferrireducens]MTI57957.1 hypothetical protein [Geosporobacter ferrireducens]
MNKKEKILSLVTLLLVAVLFSKSFFLDEAKTKTEEELKFKQFVEKAVDEKVEGFLKRNNIVKYRVVSIEQISQEGISRIEYLDEQGKEYIQGTIQGQYRAKVRGYFLYLIPYKEIRVLSRE